MYVRTYWVFVLNPYFDDYGRKVEDLGKHKESIRTVFFLIQEWELPQRQSTLLRLTKISRLCSFS